MAREIELKKYQVEIEKLNIEIDQLRRPFSRPLNWVPMVLAVGGIVSAVAQYQKSSLDYERSAFKLEKQAADTKEKLETMKEKVEAAQAALFDANQVKIETKKSTDILRAKQSKLQAALSKLNTQIADGRLEVASLEKKISNSDTGDELKEISQKITNILENEQNIIDETMSFQIERLDMLVVGINDGNSTTRNNSTIALINEFQSSKSATKEVLSLFDEGAIEELSADGRINALAFLGATKPEAWTPVFLALAKKKIALIKERQNLGKGIGTITRKQITKLVELIERYEA